MPNPKHKSSRAAYLPDTTVPSVELESGEQSPAPSIAIDIIGEIKLRRDLIAQIEADLMSVPRVAVGYVRVDYFRDAAFVNLALARGWLGKALGALGSTYPYPESMNPESPIVEKPAYSKPKAGRSYNTAIAGLKDLRGRIQEVYDSLEHIFDTLPPYDNEVYARLCGNQSAIHLSNAKMMLGEDLGLFGGY